MKKPPDIESPQPTSETQPQATALEGPTWSRGIRGGFVVNPGTLTAIERILSSFVAEGGAEVPDTKEVIVLYYGHPPDTIDSVSSVATLRNPRAFSIAEIFIVMKQGDRAAIASFHRDGDNECAALRFSPARL